MKLSNFKLAYWQNIMNWLPIIQWVAWFFVVFLLAKIFWVWGIYFMGPSESQNLQMNRSVNSSNTSKTMDISQLLNMNLFGSIKVEKAQVDVPVDAPETKLNLKLTGIYSADEKIKANAIIENGRGKQAVYFIDEQLKDVSGRVFLREVYFDRVIIETNGKRETLRLSVEELPKLARRRSSSSNRPIIQDKRDDKKLNRNLSKYRDKFLDDPKSIIGVINPKPHQIDGQLVGFKVSPGKDRELFKSLGLKRGDVITSINGVQLNNMQEAMGLLNDVESLQDMSVEIQRGEESINLLLGLEE